MSATWSSTLTADPEMSIGSEENGSSCVIKKDEKEMRK